MFHATTIVRGCKTVSAGVKGTFGILPERKKLAERALAMHVTI